MKRFADDVDTGDTNGTNNADTYIMGILIYYSFDLIGVR